MFLLIDTMLYISVYRCDAASVMAALLLLNNVGKFHASFAGEFCSDSDYRRSVRDGGDKLLSLWMSRSDYEHGTFRYTEQNGLFDIIKHYARHTLQLIRRTGQVLLVRSGLIKLNINYLSLSKPSGMFGPGTFMSFCGLPRLTDMDQQRVLYDSFNIR